jgi:hypothetical protein
MTEKLDALEVYDRLTSAKENLNKKMAEENIPLITVAQGPNTDEALNPSLIYHADGSWSMRQGMNSFSISPSFREIVQSYRDVTQPDVHLGNRDNRSRVTLEFLDSLEHLT